MLYLDLFCETLSKICPKMSEKPKRVCRDVTLSIKQLFMSCLAAVHGMPVNV